MLESKYPKIKTAEVEDKGGLNYPDCFQTLCTFYIPKTHILTQKVGIEICTPDSNHPYSFRTDSLGKLDEIILGLIKARTRFLEVKLREEKQLKDFRMHLGYFIHNMTRASEDEIEKIRSDR